MAFAEVSDVEARWHQLSADEEARASVLIDDASAILAKLVPVDDSDDAQAYLLREVCANMVIRAMGVTDAASFGADSMSMTAGPYSQSWQYSNPSGALYLTKMEKRLLGISTSYIGTIRPMMMGDHDDWN